MHGILGFVALGDGLLLIGRLVFRHYRHRVIVHLAPGYTWHWTLNLEDEDWTVDNWAGIHEQKWNPGILESPISAEVVFIGLLLIPTNFLSHDKADSFQHVLILLQHS
jgi:hypothetical protein